MVSANEIGELLINAVTGKVRSCTFARKPHSKRSWRCRVTLSLFVSVLR